MSQPQQAETEAELKQIEKRIETRDAEGVPDRWESGRILLRLRGGRKQLPHGLADQLVKSLGIHRSELTARMKFAEKFPEEELTNVISQFKTWFAIKQQALTNKTRTTGPDQERAADRQAKKAFDLLESIESAEFGKDGLDWLIKIDKQVKRHLEAAAALQDSQEAA
jgi:hypothetical protein